MTDAHFKNADGDLFAVRTLYVDGVRCRECGRVIRVRERAACFVGEADHAKRFKCRECMLAEPVTEHNQWLATLRAEGGALDDRADRPDSQPA